MTAGGTDRALSLLGLARCARELLIGQDRVLAALKAGRGLFIVASEDCSPNVLRKARAASGGAVAVLGVSREALGASIGVMNAQIAALPSGSGFVKKLKELLKQGGS